MWVETLEKVRFCRKESLREAGGVHIPVQAASAAGFFFSEREHTQEGQNDVTKSAK